MTMSVFVRASPLPDATAILLAGIVIVIATGLAFPEFRQGSPCLWDVFNDQFNYLSTARNLADEGRLQSDVVYPSLLRQENAFAFLYAPGTPIVFAASYALLGDGLLSVIAPGVLAYLLGGLAVWYSASRLSGRLAGLAAGLLYLAFPMHAAFLHTAMTEQLLSAACALALALACASEKRRFAWLAAGAVLLAVVLRETALTYFVILAGLVMTRSASALRLGLLAAPVLAFLIGLALVWGFMRSHPSLFLVNLLVDSDSAVYHDAFALDHITVDAPAIVGAMGERLARSAEMFFSTSTLNPEEHVVLGMILVVLGICLVRGLMRKDWFLLSVGLSGIFAVFLLGSTYKIEFFKGSRFLALLWPACCVAIAVMVSRLQSVGGGFVAVLLAVNLLTTQSLSEKRAAVCEDWFEVARVQEEILSAHAKGAGGVIVADGAFGMSWVLKNPGTRWAFLPENIETFRLLRHSAGADLVVLRSASEQSAAVVGLRSEGYEVVGSHSSSIGRYMLLAPAAGSGSGGASSQ